MVAELKYDDDTILDAMAAEVAESGVDGASVKAVCRRSGAPSGSIYHRWPSRKHLLGALWVRTLREYLDMIERAVEPVDGPTIAADVTGAIFGWIAAHQTESILLMRFRTDDLVENDWPSEIRLAVAEQNQRMADIVNRVADGRGVNPLDAILGIIDIPTAAARRAVAFDNDVVTEAIEGRTAKLVSDLLGTVPV